MSDAVHADYDGTVSVERVSLFGQAFHRLTIEQATATVDRFVSLERPHVVAAKNVSGLVACDQDPLTRDFYERCDLLTVDGRPLYYASRLSRTPLPELVGGPRLWARVAAMAAERGYSLFLLGGEPGVAEQARDNLLQRHRHIRVVGVHHGRLQAESDRAAAIRRIMDQRPDVVFVGLPYPLRETMTDRLVGSGYAGVCVLIGGMLDVFAEKRKLAPTILNRLCLEWAYRVVQEPRRLGLRYLRDGTRFAVLIVRWVVGSFKQAIRRQRSE